MGKVLAVMVLGIGLVLLPSDGNAVVIGLLCWHIGPPVNVDIALACHYDGPTSGPNPIVETCPITGTEVGQVATPAAISGALFWEGRREGAFNIVATVGQRHLGTSSYHFQVRISPIDGLGFGLCQAVNPAAHPCGTGTSVSFTPLSTCPTVP